MRSSVRLLCRKGAPLSSAGSGHSRRERAPAGCRVRRFSGKVTAAPKAEASRNGSEMALTESKPNFSAQIRFLHQFSVILGIFPIGYPRAFRHQGHGDDSDWGFCPQASPANALPDVLWNSYDFSFSPCFVRLSCPPPRGKVTFLRMVPPMGTMDRGSASVLRPRIFP